MRLDDLQTTLRVHVCGGSRRGCGVKELENLPVCVCVCHRSTDGCPSEPIERTFPTDFVLLVPRCGRTPRFDSFPQYLTNVLQYYYYLLLKYCSTT
jgi:hypothetical protein